jgi:hypothetical protein
MDTREIPADDPELQWIAKYRKALEASILTRQSRSNNFHAAIATMRKSIASKGHQILAKWIHPAPKFKVPARSMQRAGNRTEMRNAS